MGTALLVLFALVVLFVVVMLAKTVRIVPQARAGIVERFGKYKGTLPAGLNIVVPFIDRVRAAADRADEKREEDGAPEKEKRGDREARKADPRKHARRTRGAGGLKRADDLVALGARARRVLVVPRAKERVEGIAARDLRRVVAIVVVVGLVGHGDGLRSGSPGA